MKTTTIRLLSANLLGLVLAIAFLSSVRALCQPASLSTHIGYKDGFDESTVYAILKDRKGFMWYGTASGLWRYDGYQHKVFKHEPKNANSLSHNFIKCLMEDKQGVLWAGTLAGGLNKFDPVTNSFYHFKHDESDSTSLADDYISQIAEDSLGNIWVCGGKLSLLNKATNTFSHIENPAIKQWSPSSVYPGKNGVLWIGSNGDGFSKFDQKLKVFKNFTVTHPDPVVNIRSNVIRSIKEDTDGNIWLSTYGGLVKFDVKTETISHWVHDDADVKSLGHNSIWGIVPTKNGKLWIATWGGGISCLDTKTGLFENETFKSGGLYQMGSIEFPSLYLEDNGTIWCGSNAKGIFRIKPLSGLSYLSHPQGLLKKNIREIIKGKKHTYFTSDKDGLIAYSDSLGVAFTLSPWRDKNQNGLSGNRVSSISENKNGTLFIGTDFGLTIYDPETKKIKYLLNNPNDTTSLSHNSIITTFVDSHDRLWLGTPFGLNLLMPPTNTFAYWKRTLSAYNVISIGETREGIWVGTSTGGITVLNPEKKQIKYFHHNDKNDSTLSGNYISAIFEDSKKRLWIGTRTGLNRYRLNTQQFDRYLIEDHVLKISENKKGNLLIMSEEGLYEIPIPTDSADNISTIQKIVLPLGSVDKIWSHGENRMYLFAENEIGYLELNSYKAEASVPQIAITQFNLDPNNKHPLDSVEAMRSPIHRKEITLDYDQNLFSIEFTALDFTNPAANQYAYQLEGFDNGWTYSGTRRFVTYTNLSPGQYTFRAKGSNYLGAWNEDGASLVITILPPPWRTWWAYSLYALGFIGLLWLARKTTVNRERLKAQVAIEQTEKKTLRELDHLKTKFFSNITHEFRTPLTLIQGPANELYETANDPQAKHLLNLIRSNADRLLKLINQLLDLAKLDAQEMKLVEVPTKIDSLIAITAAQFTSLAASKEIEYNYSIAEDIPSVFADAEKIETILSNLISNAIKFTPRGGVIQTTAFWEKGFLVLKVVDTGRGIPPEKLKHVFDRFYQVNPTDSSHSEGTGIGLALVKEYTEVMKGIVEVESNVGWGTMFTIKLPLQLSADVLEPTPTHQQNAQVAADFGLPVLDTLPLLLLVEDNADIRFFIKTCLGGNYRFREAQHGKEGLAIAREEVPDIIISDWMMPEMDGVEFCKQIKKDSRTDHIPFIMLTAKGADESKIEGLQTGADEYLIKPFNKAELVLKVQNLITLREKLQARIKHYLLAHAGELNATSDEEQFIVTAKRYVEQNLAHGSLSVEMLAAEMSLSREQCYRKLSALTGFSPSAFIRKLRLQKAAQLLATKAAPVSQVAYQTGFGNLSHFSKAFKEEFGKLPSEY